MHRLVPGQENASGKINLLLFCHDRNDGKRTRPVEQILASVEHYKRASALLLPPDDSVFSVMGEIEWTGKAGNRFQSPALKLI